MAHDGAVDTPPSVGGSVGIPQMVMVRGQSAAAMQILATVQNIVGDCC